MQKSAFEKWRPLLLAIILISPLFTLPRPTNVSSIPWRVELLFSLFVILYLFVGKSSKSEVITGGSALRSASLFICAFVVWSALSTFWAASPTAAVHHTLLWSNYAIALVLSYSISSQSGGRSRVLYLFASITLLIGVLSCFDFLTIQDFTVQEGTLRIRYAKFAEMMITFAPFLFAIPIIARSKRALVGGLTIALLAWCTVMLSLSKGAFLAGTAGLVVSFLLIAIFKSKLRQRTALVATSWIAVTIIFQIGFSYLTSIPSTAEYISGSHQTGPNTSDMRIFTWRVARQMFADDPIIGVGGDNFGLSVNRARIKYSHDNPNDLSTAIGEDYIFERSHNEIIQIACELGVVGLVLFVGFSGTILFILFREISMRGKQLSPLFFGAVGGMSAFAASSMVSSFSFRAFQNGLIFMILLGFAVSYIKVRDRSAELADSRTIYVPQLKWFAASAAVMLAIFSFSKAASYVIHYRGERSNDIEVAVSYFKAASRLDPDNAGAELSSAESLARKGRWAESIPHFRRAIDRGYGVSVVYSYLANAQEMNGDLRSAEQSLREAAEILPRSTFIRARLAYVLERQGRQSEANAELAISRATDERQTNGWYSVIKDGILNAHLNSVRDPDKFAKPPDLLPAGAVLAYNDDKVRFDPK